MTMPQETFSYNIFKIYLLQLPLVLICLHLSISILNPLIKSKRSPFHFFIKKFIRLLLNKGNGKPRVQMASPWAFFLQNWESIGLEVCSLIKGMIFGTLPIENFNLTDLVLIAKGNDQTSPSNYRPISLNNSIYKVFAKILSKRSSAVLPNLTSPYQCAFIKGRIATNISMIGLELDESQIRITSLGFRRLLRWSLQTEPRTGGPGEDILMPKSSQALIEYLIKI